MQDKSDLSFASVLSRPRCCCRRRGGVFRPAAVVVVVVALLVCECVVPIFHSLMSKAMLVFFVCGFVR